MIVGSRSSVPEDSMQGYPKVKDIRFLRAYRDYVNINIEILSISTPSETEYIETDADREGRVDGQKTSTCRECGYAHGHLRPPFVPQA